MCPHADNHHIGANHTKHTHGTHFSGCLKKTDNYVNTLAQLPVFTQPKLSLWPNWESQRISQFFFSYICEFFSQNTTQPKTELEQQVWIVPELDFSFNKPSVLYSTLLHTSPQWHQESLLLITCRGSIKCYKKIKKKNCIFTCYNVTLAAGKSVSAKFALARGHLGYHLGCLWKGSLMSVPGLLSVAGGQRFLHACHLMTLGASEGETQGQP